jgi:hypothetical protein
MILTWNEVLVCQENLLVENILERLHGCFLGEVDEAWPNVAGSRGKSSPPHAVWNIRGTSMFVFKVT